jgi:hypothetical protein
VLLCLLVLPNLFYLAMRLDQDIAYRFFLYIPLGVAVLLAMNARLASRPAVLWTGLALWAVFIAAPVHSVIRNFRYYQWNNRVAIGRDLAQLPHGTMIVTEPGILPFYSHWAAYDAWGLNTAEFSKRLFQPADVEAIRPDLIFLHTIDEQNPCTRSADWQTPYTERTWQHLTRNIIAGTRPEKYELWLTPFGVSPYRKDQPGPGEGEQECWFVRRDSPLRAEIEGVLEEHGGITEAEYEARRATKAAE